MVIVYPLLMVEGTSATLSGPKTSKTLQACDGFESVMVVTKQCLMIIAQWALCHDCADGHSRSVVLGHW